MPLLLIPGFINAACSLASILVSTWKQTCWLAWNGHWGLVSAKTWGQWLPVLCPICPHPTARPTHWPVLRAARAVNKAGSSFLGADLLLNYTLELRRVHWYSDGSSKRGFSLPRSWNSRFLDPRSKTLLIHFRKVHQSPDFNILWHGTILLPAANTSLKGRWDLQV